MGNLGQLDEGYRGAFDVAIIGSSCRFPGANSMDDLWRVMINGEDLLRTPPEDRYYMGEGRIWPRSYLSCPIDEFDAGFFNFNRRQAEFMDPQLRLFLELSWESLEDARIPPSSLWNTDTGVFVGICTNEYRELTAHKVTDKTRMYSYMGTEWSAYPGFLSFFLGLNGPNISTETACASTGTAIYEAVQFLRKRECRVGLVAGTNLRMRNQLNLPNSVFGDACKAFDESATGFAPGEGVAVVVLKLLENAQADGDRILGVIKGVATNNCGFSRSFGTPNPVLQAEALRNALKDADVEAGDISYFLAHGTGTRVGDPVEAKGIVEVFGNPTVPRPEPLIISSPKTNFGHTLASSGIHSLLHTLLCFKHGKVPPTVHFKKLNPKIDFDSIPAYVPNTSVDWSSSPNGMPRLSAFNNFGLTGCNVAVVLAEAPPSHINSEIIQNSLPQEQRLPLHFIPISAKSQKSLTSLCEKLKHKLEYESPDLTEFAYSLQTTRTHHAKRIAILARDRLDAISKLSQSEFDFQGDVKLVPGQPTEPIAFLFTGQGSEYFEMAKGLYDGSPVFRALYEPCASTFKSVTGKGLAELLWEDEEVFDSLSAKWRQPAIFCIQYLLAQFWTEALGIRPSVVLGHSLGEICAAVTAGVFSFKDALNIICCRAALVETMESGGMMAVSTDKDFLTPLIQSFNSSHAPHWVDLSAVNSKEQCVVSGPRESLAVFKTFVLEAKNDLKVKVLRSTHAFHSRQVDKILEAYRPVFESVKFSPPNCTFVSSVTGEVQKEFSAAYWLDNMRQPVLFKKGLETVLNLEVPPKVFVEVGPQPALLNFLSETGVENITVCPSLRAADQFGWPTLLKSLSKIYTSWNGPINWLALHGGQKPRVIDLPFYPFNKRVYNLATATDSPGGSQNEFVHPFLGWAFTTPHSSLPAFKNTLSPSHPQVSFIKDHVMLGRLILPGSCFVEMLLNIEKYLHYENLSVTDVTLLKPFEFEQWKQADIEVTLQESDDSDGHDATLWIRKQDTLEKVFTGSLRHKTDRLISPPALDMTFVGQDGIAVGMYPKAAECGLEYEELFQSITTLWPLWDDYSVAKIKTPEDSEAHILHPVVIDAMVHSASMDFETGEYKMFPSLSLPAQFKYFHIYKHQSDAKLPLYLKLDKKNPDCTELYDSEGSLIAACAVVPLITTKQDFEASLTGNLPMPDFYTESWIPLPAAENSDENVNKLQNGYVHQWLIFTPPKAASVAVALYEQLTNDIGVDITLVTCGIDFKVGKHNITINPYNFSHYELLAKECPKVEGVISLWGLGDEATNGSGHLAKAVTSNFIGGFLNTLKFVGTLSDSNNFLAVTQGSIYGASGPLAPNFISTTLQGALKSFVTENPHISVTGVDLDPTQILEPVKIANQICNQIRHIGIERELVIRDGNVSCARLLPLKPTLTPGEFQIPLVPFGLTSTGSGVQKRYEPVTLKPFEPNQTIINVHSVSLNFIDVAIHRDLLGHENTVMGTDFAGTIDKVAPGSRFSLGDRVCGAYHRHLPMESHLTLERAGFVFRIPSWMSFDEGSTLPIALCTAYLGVYVAGNLKRGDRVLIHTASGGFGLAAIQVAKYAGAEIFVTAGSEKKREYLRTVVGIDNVYNSRDTKFEQEILKATNGKGIDLVVNTITAEGFKDASLALVCKNRGGRFIEMSKIDTWTTAEVQRLRPDVTYTHYDLLNDDFSDLSAIEKLLETGQVRGMPHKVTTIDHITKTLNEFSESNHIGKFVLQMGNKTRLFKAESSYLITGGLGGIGMVVASWLLEQGAGKVILTGRRQPTDPFILEKLKEFGDSVAVILSDVGEPTTVKALFSQIKATQPPLKGIFHSAGLLKDGVISGLNVGSFEEAFQSKVDGTWNLHNESLDLDLDYFVLFSSIACNVGFAGQAPYTAANNFLDTFVKYRVNNLGLPATGINWGGWSDVGIAVNHLSPEQMNQMTQRSGIHWFSAEEGIRALERALRLDLEQSTIIKFDEEKMGITSYPRLNTYFSKIREHKLASGRAKGAKKDGGAKEEKRNVLAELALNVKNAEGVEKLSLLETLIEKCFRMYVSLPDDEAVDRGHALSLYGMDSLMELEITNRLSKELGIVIPRGKLREQQTISAFAKNLFPVIKN